MNTRKITRSDKWFMDALLQLMKMKPYNKIKITDIAGKADLNCRTFYRHFNSKDDVLKLYCESLVAELPDMIFQKGTLTMYSVTVSYFEFCEKNVDFLLLLKKHGLTYFLLDHYDHLRELVKNQIKPNASADEYGGRTPYMFAFILGGYWNIVNQWLLDTPRKSPEEMARIVVEIIFEKNI